ncbi:GNAT family N-acetyltransferase [Paenibacillus protaetiae]|uniref:GNAT family N-acetyltransferase n=1 Tax=Paenibacillus protaetiae TaxID=2509456 RepID=A0A4V0YF56_9BACL|nr:GNAT family N-acetyltransferase [Paenibacillus protaetiae]QAY66541.1 GNAT family N-acetyltransferase [Paenibacillus protaetiae]
MTEQVRLVKPTAELRDEYLAFYEEWKESGEEMVPWVISKDPSDFPMMLQSLFNQERGENLPEGWVPDSTYWLITDSNKVVGAVNIRHKLSEKLYNTGGHIGYGIRASERRKGYATKLLALALEQAKQLGIGKVLVVCDQRNAASKKTILKNGGIQDASFIEEDGNVIERFWIG